MAQDIALVVMVLWRETLRMEKFTAPSAVLLLKTGLLIFLLAGHELQVGMRAHQSAGDLLVSRFMTMDWPQISHPAQETLEASICQPTTTFQTLESGTRG